MRPLFAAALALLAVLGAPDASRAAWPSAGGGSHFAKAITLPTVSQPTASVTNRSVAVSWSAVTLPGGAAVDGYEVRRYDNGGALQSIGSACSGTIAATSCTESAVPPGTWRYTVAARKGNWTGPESSQSSAVTVAAPSLSLAPATVASTSLPASVSGSLANYVPGQTITLRLDNPTTGTVLSGTVTPSTIPAGGGASVSVTIPSGTSPGAHTVYAVGSGGDTASAPVGVTASFTTAPWDLRDLSSGRSVNSSAQYAFASDSRTFNTGNWSSSFSTSRWVDFDMNAPLRSGQTVTGANFNFRRAATQSGDTLCFYFEVRRISTGAVLATHGSSGSPVGCVTGTTQTTTSTPIPSINTSVLAGDVRIRVYARNTGSRPASIDLATVTGTADSTAFTLHANRYNDAADGSATLFPWSLWSVDGTYYTSGSNWTTSFSTSQYLTVTFPAYVPAGATVSNATFRHSHRPADSSNTSCWYAETWSGGALLATHGSSGSPVSCQTGTSFATSTLTLTEVNTVARANDLTVRIYERVTGGSSTRTSRHDLAELSVTYVP